ncbi:MAG: sodium/proline symporter PutP [Bifidobacteriaceae bacterium]|jgi:sodium/proline symporter|nr:sodium/proline symporter PutP [Bifidobacteriaceae bacterium]
MSPELYILADPALTNKHPAWTAAAIVCYLALMLFIGYRAYRSTGNIDDYMLGGRRLPPAVAALSAGAADMSGWLLMGLPGALYASGLVEAWIAIGLTVGAWFNWKLVAPRLRSYTEIAGNALTIPSFLGNRTRDKSGALRIASGIIILVYFTFYVCSGMVAAGTFTESAFHLNPVWGIVIVGGVTLLYTLFGGFLGATWTDVAQGLLMLAALITVPIMALIQLGGPGAVGQTIADLDAIDGLHRLNLFGGPLTWAGLVAIISAAAWGLGYFGQPHIIVRFMALRSPAEAKAGRRIGIGWMILSAAGAIGAGLIGIAYFADAPLGGRKEQVFLLLAQALFHPLVAGLVLAAVLAAVMSTMSSQLVVCSSALVVDLLSLAKSGRYKLSKQQEVLAGRLAVLVVAVIAFVLSLTAQDTILKLVAFAWAGFGASFGPVIILSLYWRRLTNWGALAGMVTGAVTVFIWGNIPVLTENLYEILPGFVLNLVVALIVSALTAKPSSAVTDEFESARQAALARVAPPGAGAGAGAAKTYQAD